MKPKNKSANQIALELETEAKRLLEISRNLKGKKTPGRKPGTSTTKAAK